MLYYLGGGAYLSFDGEATTAVAPYVPTVVAGRAPTGGGSFSEDYNRLGTKIRNSFSGDGSSTAYTLTDADLDAAAVTCTVNGASKTEGSDFTVNRAAGIVTFSAAPPAGDNNVVVTFSKTVPSQLGSILGCTCACAFGGQNDSRLFFGGNGTGSYYWSAASSPNYFPLGNVNLPGLGDDAVTAFGLQNDTLVIFKNRSIFGVTYEYSSSGKTAVFPCVSLNSEIGCDCPGSLCLIDNRLTWLSSERGVVTLTSESAGAGVYHNVYPLSRNINGTASRSGLLGEEGLAGACGADFGRRYWLGVNGHVWLWDYGLTPYKGGADLDSSQKALSWWYFEGIDACCFAQEGGTLWFGTGEGNILQFEWSFLDCGGAIPAHWKSKVLNFGLPGRLKSVRKLWLSCRADTASCLTITYFTDQSPSGGEDPCTVQVAAFDLGKIDLSAFSLGTPNWFVEYLLRPPVRDCGAFSVQFENSNPSQDLNAADLVIEYTFDREVRRGG